MLIAALMFATPAGITPIYYPHQFTDPVEQCDGRRWACPKHYPVKAILRKWEGTTSFMVTVSVEGRVAECRITESSGYRMLDMRTCEVLFANAKFKPATNGDGTPVSGTYASKMRWVLPKSKSKDDAEQSTLKSEHDP